MWYNYKTWETVLFVNFTKITEELQTSHRQAQNFSLDIRTWSPETQTNISLILCGGVWTHSAPLVSLHIHWKYLKLSFFETNMWHEVALRILKSSRLQIFFRTDVLKNFAIFKGNTWVFFNKVTDLQLCGFIKKGLQFRYFPLNIAKFLGTAFFIEHFRRLVLDLVSNLQLNLFLPNN